MDEEVEGVEVAGWFGPPAQKTPPTGGCGGGVTFGCGMFVAVVGDVNAGVVGAEYCCALRNGNVLRLHNVQSENAKALRRRLVRAVRASDCVGFFRCILVRNAKKICQCLSEKVSPDWS